MNGTSLSSFLQLTKWWSPDSFQIQLHENSTNSGGSQTERVIRERLISQSAAALTCTHTHTHTVNTTSTWSLRQPFIILFWVQKCRWEWSRTRAERDKETINPWPQSDVTAWTGHCVNASYLNHTDALWLFAFTLMHLAKVTYINIAFKMHNYRFMHCLGTQPMTLVLLGLTYKYVRIYSCILIP